VATGDIPREGNRQRTTVLAFLIGYGGFVAGTLVIPISPALGGIIFWGGVFVIFWAGWYSGKK
jgi:hypothetical protein